jgi:hypothetical protein
MPEDKLRGIAWQVQRWPRLYKADTLARLQLRFAERATLKITTIGAIDMDQEKRKLRRAKQHQAKMEKRRRILGAKPRAEYEANALSNTKPWEQEIPPISRRTWERHRKASVASLCPAVASADAASFLSIAASAPATAVSLPPAWLLTSPAWTKPRDTPYGPVSPLALRLAFWMQAQKSRSHSATTTVASPAAA